MGRGFGIEATTMPDVVVQVARAAEEAGYSSFWVNGSPPRQALEALAVAASVTSIPLGVGVIPLHRRPIEQVVTDVRELGLPQDRLRLGIGYGQPRGALATMRHSVAMIHEELESSAVVGAVGPRMTALAGEIGDAVIFTWWFAAAVRDSRQYLEAGAEGAGRNRPPIISYIRCALLPQAESKLEEQANAYDSSPKFARVFAHYGVTARDTVVTGNTAADLQSGIVAEEAVLDEGVVRAIPADDSAGSLLDLLEACAPPKGG